MRLLATTALALIVGCSAPKKSSPPPPSADDDRLERILDMMQQQTQAYDDLRTSMLATRAKADAAPEKIAEEVASKMASHQQKQEAADPRLDEVVALLKDLKQTPPAPMPGPVSEQLQRADQQAVGLKTPAGREASDDEQKPVITIYCPRWCRGSDCRAAKLAAEAGDDMFEYRLMTEEPFPKSVQGVAQELGYPVVMWQDPRKQWYHFDRRIDGLESNWPGQERLARAYGKTIAEADVDKSGPPDAIGEDRRSTSARLGALLQGRRMTASAARDAGARMKYSWHQSGADEDLLQHMVRLHGFTEEELRDRDPQELVSMHDGACRGERQALRMPSQAARLESQQSQLYYSNGNGWSIQGGFQPQLQYGGFQPQSQYGGSGMICVGGRCYPQ